MDNTQDIEMPQVSLHHGKLALVVSFGTLLSVFGVGAKLWINARERAVSEGQRLEVIANLTREVEKKADSTLITQRLDQLQKSQDEINHKLDRLYYRSAPLP